MDFMPSSVSNSQCAALDGIISHNKDMWPVLKRCQTCLTCKLCETATQNEYRKFYFGSTWCSPKTHVSSSKCSKVWPTSFKYLLCNKEILSKHKLFLHMTFHNTFKQYFTYVNIQIRIFISYRRSFFWITCMTQKTCNTRTA